MFTVGVILFWIMCIWASCTIAHYKGYEPGIWLLYSVLFGAMAVLVVSVIPPKG